MNCLGCGAPRKLRNVVVGHSKFYDNLVRCRYCGRVSSIYARLTSEGRRAISLHKAGKTVTLTHDDFVEGERHG